MNDQRRRGGESNAAERVRAPSASILHTMFNVPMCVEAVSPRKRLILRELDRKEQLLETDAGLRDGNKSETHPSN
jgi:hypothetical protein